MKSTYLLLKNVFGLPGLSNHFAVNPKAIPLKEHTIKSRKIKGAEGLK